MREVLRRFAFAAAAVAVVVLIVVLGWAIPPRAAIVSTDRLGPESGERVADYLARARDSLSGTDTAEHWALASFGAGAAAERLPELAAGLRISQVLYHVPLDRVYTPVTAVPVPAGDAAAIGSLQAAAGAMDYAQPAEERAARTAAVVAARLHAGCACAVGVVVRGRLDQLRELSSRNGVRSVEALPADAAAGAFAVVPLLPEQLDVVTPGPDDGPVPDR
ncbi:hypothetical protein [Nocardia blacklockiae]|uniref:hypothetical protein n=1 Tax=Nocardia blacklockiae TaxID=480036 RepID=UPI001895AE61|nr:hypothetical protein [Nocardia blacklockiae]MBF6174171.1 hypothetical protein [Nocardia blacklockiae]